MRRLFRLAGGYYAIQALAVLAWWGLLVLQPEQRSHFVIDAGAATSLLAFWLPDLVLIAGGSAIASVLSFRLHRWLMPFAWLTAGAVAYATLYCLAGALMADRGWLGLLLMLPAMLLSMILPLALHPDVAHLFRQARPAAVSYNLFKTAAQIVVFWGTLLFLVPWLLVELQRKIGVALVAVPGQRVLGVILLVVFSALGLWSGITMARRGGGTPLPMDCTTRLVVAGPYAWVRNPMAVAGLGQGLSVTVFTGSFVVFAYTILGTLIWQCIVRPLEEADLLRRFGPAYEDYRRQVRCWVPAAAALTRPPERTVA